MDFSRTSCRRLKRPRIRPAPEQASWQVEVLSGDSVPRDPRFGSSHELSKLLGRGVQATRYVAIGPVPLLDVRQSRSGRYLLAVDPGGQIAVGQQVGNRRTLSLKLCQRVDHTSCFRFKACAAVMRNETREPLVAVTTDPQRTVDSMKPGRLQRGVIADVVQVRRSDEKITVGRRDGDRERAGSSDHTLGMRPPRAERRESPLRLTRRPPDEVHRSTVRNVAG